MDNLFFRIAQHGDEPSAIELFNNLMNDGLNYLTDMYPFNEENLEGYLEENMKHNITIFALINQKIIGWVTLTRRSLKFQKHIGLLLIGVLPEYQNNHVGNKLIFQIEKMAPQIQIEKIEVSIRKTSTKTLRFFLNLGYIVEGEKVKSVKTNYGYESEIVLGKIIRYQ
ncbi:MAG: GNAT family N-acetyltransferase [Patescibacteria group bacterium]|nr:GNAT family N-acetyltransferase [Patescibacteria group bacterium]MCL5095654.1 GNAT family N-acetyltransferase [Patescibacteria group bacterium]